MFLQSTSKGDVRIEHLVVAWKWRLPFQQKYTSPLHKKSSSIDWRSLRYPSKLRKTFSYPFFQRRSPKMFILQKLVNRTQCMLTSSDGHYRIVGKTNLHKKSTIWVSSESPLMFSFTCVPNNRHPKLIIAYKLGEHAGFISGHPLTRGIPHVHSLIKSWLSLFVVFSTATWCRDESRGLDFNLHRPPA